MMDLEAASAGDLPRSVQAYRVRYEVVREATLVGASRRVASLEVWIWATLPRGARALPGSPECRLAVRAATRVAEAAVAAEPGRDAEIEPFRQRLYDSRQLPGCDELYVAIRLWLRFDAGGEAGPSPEPRLRALKGRLEGLGVFEGRWRPPPPPADPWSVRPAAAAFGLDAVAPAPPAAPALATA